MSKFIKVTLVGNEEASLFMVNSISEIKPHAEGSLIVLSDGSVIVSEEIEQIEAQLLRDEFAMMAMEAVLSAITIADGIDRYDQCASNEQLASHAYDMADAMLKERLK